jgi:hypothetical protein
MDGDMQKIYKWFGHDETFVDWYAIQHPKIAKIYRKLGIEE